MQESKADLMLHPIRMRIIQSVIGGRKLTAQQFAEELSDVPIATLYRHINKLAKGGILTVVDQNQVRGAMEKVYALSEDGPGLSMQDLLAASRDDHMRYFMTFLAGLMDGYHRYLQQDQIDLQQDLVSYRTATLYLTDEESMTLLRSMAASIQEAMANGPGPGRRKRTLSNIFIPEPLDSKSTMKEE